MKGKKVLVTGSNNGIGFEAAKSLAAAGADLIVHARNAAKAEDTRNRIRTAVPDAAITTVSADFESLKEVRQMASQVLEMGPLDVLLNNAGLFSKDRYETAKGYEKTFAVNHLAPFLLTNLLIPAIKQADEPRIVNVASDAHRRDDIHFDDLHFNGKWSAIGAYCQSKLANVLFTKQLAAKIEAGDFDGDNPGNVRKIKTNALHPGVVNTNISNGTPGFFGFVWKLMGPFMYTSEKGAQTSIYLASSDEREARVSGEYFVKSRQVKSSPASYNMENAARLWEISEEMTDLK